MLIMGHSHIECIVDAAQARGMDLPWVNLWGFEDAVVEDEKGRRLNGALAARMQDMTVSVVAGGDHHVLGLIVHDIPFDFILPSAPDLPLVEGARIIPCDQVRATLAEMSDESFEVMRQMAKASPGPVLHLTPPPILREEKPILDPLWIARVGPSQVVSPPYFRMKLSLLFMEILREVCEEAGIVLVPWPDGTYDEEGFMRPEFIGNPCHGNRLYGDKVLDQLAEIGARGWGAP